MDPSRRHVGPDPIAFDFSAIERLVQRTTDAVEPRSPLPTADQRFGAANRNVLEERQNAAGRQKLLKDRQNFFNLVDGKIIQRQTGNNHCVSVLRRANLPNGNA